MFSEMGGTLLHDLKKKLGIARKMYSLPKYQYIYWYFFVMCGGDECYTANTFVYDMGFQRKLR